MVDSLGQSCRTIRWLVLMRFEASSRMFTVDLCVWICDHSFVKLPETSISQTLALSREDIFPCVCFIYWVYPFKEYLGTILMILWIQVNLASSFSSAVIYNKYRAVISLHMEMEVGRRAKGRSCAEALRNISISSPASNPADCQGQTALLFWQPEHPTFISFCNLSTALWSTCLLGKTWTSEHFLGRAFNTQCK